MHKEIVIILDDIRSCYNVGSIFRTADAAGAHEIALCGITPYPRVPGDTRSERVIENNTKMIHKTALDAENSVKFQHFHTVLDAIKYYADKKYQIVALENKVEGTANIFTFKPEKNIALVVGSETEGIDPQVINMCDATIEIPMHGIKNSLNVSVATGIALYVLSQAKDLG
ncbi:MAG: TrmH family RNA methyltransferase [Candidatus Saccharibacteria bacterium]